MGLNIKNPATEAAIRELAAKRGVSLTDAIDQAVRAALDTQAEAKRLEVERRRKVIRDIQARVALLPVLDPRPSRVINDEMYGEFGEPI